MSRIIFYVSTVACFFLLLSSSAFGAQGAVVYKKSGCDYFLVETSSGYDLLEWYGGHDPSKSDRIVGDFESYGFADIYDVSVDEELHVYVEDYWLSKSDAMEKYYEHCR